MEYLGVSIHFHVRPYIIDRRVTHEGDEMPKRAAKPWTTIPSKITSRDYAIATKQIARMREFAAGKRRCEVRKKTVTRPSVPVAAAQEIDKRG